MTKKQITELIRRLVNNWYEEINVDDEFLEKYNPIGLSEYMGGYNTGVEDCAKDLEELLKKLES